MDLLKGKQSSTQREILKALSEHVRFYPDPLSEAFKRLPPVVQEEARGYWEREQERVDRIMKEYEEGEW